MSLWRVVSGGEPPTVVLVVVCVLGALAALSVVRYVVIFGTALAARGRRSSAASRSWATARRGTRVGQRRLDCVSARSAAEFLVDRCRRGWCSRLSGVAVQLATTSQSAGATAAKSVKSKK